MQRLLLLGLSHATAPLELREKLAFTHEQRVAAIQSFCRQFQGVEAVLLSTCNRVELYAARAVHGRPREDEMLAFLAAERNLSPDQLRPHVYHKAERDAVEHLFAVAASTDSMVIGETQILRQVRDAYEASREMSAAGATLHPLFQRALAVGKQVMTETGIAEGRVSVGSVAVECAGHIFDRYEDKTVLCLGAGKMASLVLQAFAGKKPRLLVCNRNSGKAAALAQQHGGEAVPFEKLDEHLVAADVVISSTSSQRPIITRESFDPLRKLRRYRPIFFIDIALPRDVEPAVGELQNVYLYNLDDLQHVVSATQSRRVEAIDHARRIIREQVDRYVGWHRARAMGPIIDRLYQRHHELARQEVQRVMNRMPNLTEADRAQLEELAHRIVNKLLHDPVTQLRESEGHGGPTAYLHALEKLFQLGDTGATPDEQDPQAS